MGDVKFSNVLWAGVAGIALLIVCLLFFWIWISYTLMWACLISGILSIVLGIIAYFAQAVIEKPVLGLVSAGVFGILGIGFLLSAAWFQEEGKKIPCLILVLVVALILLAFWAWKIRDMEREKEIKAKRKRL